MIHRPARVTTLIAGLFVAFALTGGAFGQALAGQDTAAGEAVFTANCSACHQATGAGIPSAFPPLAKHVPAILGVDGGREFLVDVLVFGTQGAVTIEGVDYNGLMPAWGHLSDQELSDVLDYIATAWGNVDLLADGFPVFTADEVATRRADGLTADQVHEKRAGLGLDGQ